MFGATGSPAGSPPQSPRKRGLFADASQEPAAKHARLSNPEFMAVFHTFDPNRTGYMELAGLRTALEAVKKNVEAGTAQQLFQRQFEISTCCWLLGRFGTAARLSPIQWCELLDYLQTVKAIFQQVDVDNSGKIEFGELHRAFQLSGLNLDPSVVVQVGQSFDANKDNSLEFDEFVQLRLEWDYYIEAWEQHTGGASNITPAQLLHVLESIKKSLDPVRSVLSSSDMTALLQRGLFYSSQLATQRPFQAATCERLIIRFGKGSLFLTFEQFCTMLIFLKELKTAFCKYDVNGSGSLSPAELINAFQQTGMNLPSQLVQQIAATFDTDHSGEIEFDEFIQMATEWNEMWGLRANFDASNRITAEQLQQLMGSVRVLYQVVNGTIYSMRPFSLNTCKWLIAKFGSCQPGEPFAQGVTYTEFLQLVQYLKECYLKFIQFDTWRNGNISAAELGTLLAVYGLSLSPEAISNIRRSYDVDQNGMIEFDEFLQMLVECQLYDSCFNVRVQHPSILTPLNTLHPIFGQQLASSGTPGLVTLDKSAFFSLVFAVPRNLTT